MLLNELQAILEPGHSLKILPTSKYFKEENKSNKDIKSLFRIQVNHPDSKAGIFFSKYASIYYNKIEKVLENWLNGRAYITCTSECGEDITYDITWNRNRVLEKV